MEGPTYISSQIVPQNKADFPTITICPNTIHGYGYKEDILEAHGIPDIHQYIDGYNNNLNWTSNQTDVTEAHLFQMATYEIDEVIKKIFVRFLKADVSTLDLYLVY